MTGPDHRAASLLPGDFAEGKGCLMVTQEASAFTLITSASSGSGLELAGQAAADGHPLILVAQDAPRLEAAAEELRRRVTVHTIAEDLSQPGAAAWVYAQVLALGVEVDCLINNAGFGDYGP